MSEREHVVETVDVQTEAVGTQPAANSQGDSSGGDRPPADLGKVRELVLKAHPDVVPDLVVGSSVDELIASVEPARTAYQRIADRVRESREGERIVAAGRSREERDDSSTSLTVQPPVVPAGGATNVAEPGDLGPTTKIAQALAARRTK